MATIVDPSLKSQPDMGKINSFSGLQVTITKHKAAKGAPGQMVLSPQNISKEDLLKSFSQIPVIHGPGWYRYSVSDVNGNGEDTWMVLLGPDNSAAASATETQPPQYAPTSQFAEGIPHMAQFSSVPQGFAPLPLNRAGLPAMGPNMTNLGNNFFYNEDTSTLATPWGTVVNWKKGEPLPTPPPPSTSALSTLLHDPRDLPPRGGWGNIPVRDAESEASQKLRALTEQIAEDKRRQELEAIRNENRQSLEALNKTILALAEKMTARPAGPSEETLALKAELAETRRRQEEREREDRQRAEMREFQEKTAETLRRATESNKPDPMTPMLTLLMQMMQTSSQASSESVKAIHAATTAASAASERNLQTMMTQMGSQAMSPLQLVQLLQSAKGDGVESSRMIIESVKESMSLQKTVFEQLLEVSSQGGQPAWLSAVQTVMDRVGPIGAAIAERAAQAQAQAVPQIPAPRQMPQQRVAPPQFAQTMTAPPLAAPQQLGPTGRPVPERLQPNLSPSEQMRAEAAAQVGLGSSGIPADQRAFNQQTALETQQFAEKPVSLNGASGHATLSEVPDVVQAPPKKNKGGRPRGSKNKPKNPDGYSIAEMREMDPEAVREAVSLFGDDVFFGMALSHVQQLRTEAPEAEEVAKFVLQARTLLQGAGQFPPALELLAAGQIDILVERLFPDHDEEYCDGVVDAISERLEEEEGAATAGEAEDEESEGAQA